LRSDDHRIKDNCAIGGHGRQGKTRRTDQADRDGKGRAFHEYL
jgi:hypothetical protein